MKPTTTEEPTIDETSIAAGDCFEYIEGGITRRFILTRVDRLGRCWGSHVGTRRPAGAGWTRRRLARGWRCSRRISTGPAAAARAKSGRYYDPETKATPAVRVQLPRGFGASDVQAVRRLAAGGKTAKEIAASMGVSVVVIESLIGRAT